MTVHSFFVSCPKGLEYLLGDELTALGLQWVRNAPAGVWVQGTLTDGYRACLWSRLANRVVLHLAEVDGRTGDTLYDGIKTIDWHQHLAPDGRFRVQFAGQNQEIRNTLFGVQRAKDAVVDSLRSASGQRPSVDVERPDITVSVHLHRDKAQVGLDLSGQSLHMRGYRLDKGLAPLKENLAAALLIRADWPQIAAAGGSLLDPMCGSGTLLIEGALMALDHAPGLLRTQFGFEHWLGHDAEAWQTLLMEARTRAEQGRAGFRNAIHGYDEDPRVIDTAHKNIERAGLTGLIQVARRRLVDFQPDPGFAEQGLLLTNPPYGERLSERQALPALYESLGQIARDHLAGWRMGVFTGVPEMGRSIGLRSDKQYKLFNGKLPAQLLLFRVEARQAMTPRAPLMPGETRPRIANPARAEMLANRLRKNLKALGQWARKQDISCYRLYDADMPEFALAIDLYEGRVHVQEYAAPKSVEPEAAQERWAEALAVIAEVLEVKPQDMVCKQRQRQAGTSQYERQDRSGEFFTVTEAGCRLRVNLKDYLDTGLFLDHRPARRWVQAQAAGKRFLNLFCYTGAATVHAVVGGARSSLSLDMSKTYVAWASENLRLNGADESRHKVMQADCLKWLAEPAREMFDLIFLDPPTFSNSARMEGVLDVQRDHETLVRQAMDRLTPDGLLIFSNNYRRFKLAEALAEDFEVEDVTQASLDKDFQRNSRIHQCWKIRHRAL
ncbi:MAG: bifunctional 23S rRNA (guanine(2069)-N(7))-methyltransferase RlmK/23S rRNA (guanine(2445)-N(2))-methyltransferase RlmL [Marinobacter sp.]|nr:bifunctional 23S rRNA (guanine(2069)-N(7))-methyltransferase RlmK/23S rRNA (guanine(2445)-N(2))-methyltransferase RlmL [Marinobacter sp.]